MAPTNNIQPICRKSTQLKCFRRRRNAVKQPAKCRLRAANPSRPVRSYYFCANRSKGGLGRKGGVGTTDIAFIVLREPEQPAEEQRQTSAEAESAERNVVRSDGGAPPLAPGTRIALLWDECMELRENSREPDDRNNQKRLDRLWQTSGAERRRREQRQQMLAEELRRAEAERAKRCAQNALELQRVTSETYDAELVHWSGGERAEQTASVHRMAAECSEMAWEERRAELRAEEKAYAEEEAELRVALQAATAEREMYEAAVMMELEQEAVQIIAEEALGLAVVDEEAAESIALAAKGLAQTFAEKATILKRQAEEKAEKEAAEEAEELARYEAQNRAYMANMMSCYDSIERDVEMATE